MMKRMLPAIHPGEHVKRELEYLNVSVAEYANLLDVAPPTIRRLIKCEKGITPIMALKLAATIGSTAEQWLRLQATYDLEKLRENTDLTHLSLLTPPQEIEE